MTRAGRARSTLTGLLLAIVAVACSDMVGATSSDPPTNAITTRGDTSNTSNPDTVPDDSIPDDSIPDDSIPDDSIPDDSIPGDSVPPDTTTPPDTSTPPDTTTPPDTSTPPTPPDTGQQNAQIQGTMIGIDSTRNPFVELGPIKNVKVTLFRVRYVRNPGDTLRIVFDSVDTKASNAQGKFHFTHLYRGVYLMKATPEAGSPWWPGQMGTNAYGANDLVLLTPLKFYLHKK